MQFGLGFIKYHFYQINYVCGFIHVCDFPYVASHGVNILNVMVKNELNLDTSIFRVIPSHLSSPKVTPLVFVRLTAESKIS